MPETLTIELRESGGSRPGQGYQPPPPPAYTPPAPPAPAMPAVTQAGAMQPPQPAQADGEPTAPRTNQPTAPVDRPTVPAQPPQPQPIIVQPPPPPQYQPPRPPSLEEEADRVVKMRIEQMQAQEKREELEALVKLKMEKLFGREEKVQEFTVPPPPPNIAQQFGDLLGGAGLSGIGNPVSKIGSAMEAAGPAAAQGGLAAAVPPLAIATAAKELKEKVEESARGLVKSFGQIATKAAALDGTVFAEQFEKAADQAGVLGVVASEGSRQLRSFDAALADTTKRLAQYNPTLALAEAQADLNQMFGDMRRGDLLAKDLSELTAARSRLSQASQDALARAILPLIPKLTEAIDAVVPIIIGLGKSGEVISTVLPSVLEALRVYATADFVAIPDTLTALKVAVEKAVRKLLAGDDAPKDGDKFLDDLLRARDAFRGGR